MRTAGAIMPVIRFFSFDNYVVFAQILIIKTVHLHVIQLHPLNPVDNVRSEMKKQCRKPGLTSLRKKEMLSGRLG
jgi:quinol-cytochrome oxidoreductase complex cytochrome b subunit